MKKLLSRQVKITLVHYALTDGSSDPTADNVIDMAGYDGVMFIGIVGTITTTGTATLSIYQSSDLAVADDYTAISGASAQASAAALSDRLLVIDIYQPNKRYLRALLTRATANSVWGGTIAIQYQAKDRPIVNAVAAGKLAIAAVALVNSTE